MNVVSGIGLVQFNLKSPENDSRAIEEQEYLRLLFNLCIGLEQIPERTSPSIPKEIISQHRELTYGVLHPVRGVWYLADDWLDVWKRRRLRKGYPKNWRHIASDIKDRAEWQCEHCKQDCDPKKKGLLTVHHIDGNKGNNEWPNLVALCWPCHHLVEKEFVVNGSWKYANFFIPEYIVPFEKEYWWACRRGYTVSPEGIIVLISS